MWTKEDLMADGEMLDMTAILDLINSGAPSVNEQPELRRMGTARIAIYGPTAIAMQYNIQTTVESKDFPIYDITEYLNEQIRQAYTKNVYPIGLSLGWDLMPSYQYARPILSCGGLQVAVSSQAGRCELVFNQGDWQKLMVE